MAAIEGIAIKHVARGPMETVLQAMVFINEGLEGDSRGKGGHDRARQVTLLSFYQWGEATEYLWATPRTMPWTLRRANICIRGHKFSKNDVGRHIHIGSSVILEITGETKPCSRMDAQIDGLRAALAADFRGGVTSRVIQGGRITIDDQVWWENIVSH